MRTKFIFLNLEDREFWTLQFGYSLWKVDQRTSKLGKVPRLKASDDYNNLVNQFQGTAWYGLMGQSNDAPHISRKSAKKERLFVLRAIAPRIS